MSLKTVTALSAEWHEAVAAGMDGPDAALPPPWYPAAKVGDFDILPIETSAELYREGAIVFEQAAPLGELHVRWVGSADAEAELERWAHETGEPDEYDQPLAETDGDAVTRDGETEES